jgi:hypothetical protein
MRSRIGSSCRPGLWPVYTAPASDNDSTNRYMSATSPLKRALHLSPLPFPLCCDERRCWNIVGEGARYLVDVGYCVPHLIDR